MGVSRESQLSAWRHQNQDVAVWPENWDAVQLFTRCATQWRLDPGGREYGLDYAAMTWPLRLMRLRGRRAVQAVAGVQVMEAAYINARRSGCAPS